MKQNVGDAAMAGGDSAARRMSAAMILGDRLGPKATPESGAFGLSARGRVDALPFRIDGD